MTSQETDLTFHYMRDVNVIDEMNDLTIESTYYLDHPLTEIPISEKETLVE